MLTDLPRVTEPGDRASHSQPLGVPIPLLADPVPAVPCSWDHNLRYLERGRPHSERHGVLPTVHAESSSYLCSKCYGVGDADAV